MTKLSTYTVTARSRDDRVFCGAFTAYSPTEALQKAKKDKGTWAAKALRCTESLLTWEIEEDFL